MGVIMADNVVFDQLSALEVEVETALRAINSASPPLQRSAREAAQRRAETLLQAVQDAVGDEVAFVPLSNGGKVLADTYAQLLEQYAPRARSLACRAGVAVDSWDAELQNEVMQSFSNSASSQYVGSVNPGEWATYNEDGHALSSEFQLSRGGLVSYTLVLEGNRGKLQGEGTWTLEGGEEGRLSTVRLEMRQGLTGSASLTQVKEDARNISIAMSEFRRVTVDGAEPSDDEEDDDGNEDE